MILTAFIFILFGILIKNGKMYKLIAGYNTMLEENQKKFDILGDATLMRNVFFGMSLIVFLGVLISETTDNPKIETSLFIAIIVGVPYLLVKSNLDKYKIK